MRYSGIGGQAVMEGVMMRNGDKYAVAVRKPDHEIEVDVKDYKGPSNSSVWKKLPLVRGVVNFIDSLVLGMSTLMYSASFFEDEEEEEPAKKQRKSKKDKSAEADIQKQEKQEKAMMTGVVVISIVMAVLIFMILPYYLSTIFSKITDSQTIISILEGAIRLAIFIVYILLISQMKDIQRVFMYHGAEHKTINCLEAGVELTPENVDNFSRLHKRCGTSFIFIVMIISMVFFFFIRVDTIWLRIVLRLLFLPLVAGVSYEFIRLAGSSDHPLVQIFSKPGLALQRLTTKEPDHSMIEVAIASVEGVFDWREYLENLHKGEQKEDE